MVPSGPCQAVCIHPLLVLFADTKDFLLPLQIRTLIATALCDGFRKAVLLRMKISDKSRLVAISR